MLLQTLRSVKSNASADMNVFNLDLDVAFESFWGCCGMGIDLSTFVKTMLLSISTVKGLLLSFELHICFERLGPLSTSRKTFQA